MNSTHDETDSPLISVVITSYNRAELLAEAIRSVLEQTYQDFELVIVDDGSKDHSLEVIEDFRKQHPSKIRLFTHTGLRNRGIVTTYRLGVSQSRGEFIAFLEHDDHWNPQYLARKVEIFRAFPKVGVMFSPYRVLTNSWFGRDMILRQWLLRPKIRGNRPFDNFANLLHSNNVATFSCFVARKSLLDQIPLPPKNTITYDWWVLTWLSIHSLFFYDNNGLTYWRWSRQSAMGRQTFLQHRIRGSNFIEQMYLHIEKNTDQLSNSQTTLFNRANGIIASFLAYYRKPAFTTFFRHFRQSFTWALSSTASLIINYLKFRPKASEKASR